MFQIFSADGSHMSAVEFFKLCKICKIYPAVVSFDSIKKVVLKSKEFWEVNSEDFLGHQ